MQNPESRSDSELLRLSLAGDESAFLALYERLKGGIFRYAFFMTNSRQAAEEVTQEVFIFLMKKGARYRQSRGSVGAFAFGIARNLVRRIARRERQYEPLPDADALAGLSARLVLSPEALPEQLIRGEIAQRVQSAIFSLPDHYRQIVVLCDLCDFSYTEAADRLQCAVGTVRSRLHRAHMLLRQKLMSLRSNSRAVRATGTEGCVI